MPDAQYVEEDDKKFGWGGGEEDDEGYPNGSALDAQQKIKTKKLSVEWKVFFWGGRKIMKIIPMEAQHQRIQQIYHYCCKLLVSIPAHFLCSFLLLQFSHRQVSSQDPRCHMQHYAMFSVNHPVIRAGSLPVSQVANLPGYYEIPNESRDPLLIAHNLSNVLSTMRT
jgi:hypothetical protein